MTALRDATHGEDFQHAVDAGGVVIADFFTTRCIICKRLHPMLAAVQAGYGARLSCFKIDAEQRPEIASRFDIRGVPHLLLFKGGELVDRKVGFMTASALRAWVSPHLE